MAILASSDKLAFYLTMSSTFMPFFAKKKKSRVTLESMNTQQGDLNFLALWISP